MSATCDPRSAAVAVAACAPVVAAAAGLEADAAELSAAVERMRQRARAATRSARHLAERTDALAAARTRLQKRTAAAEAFAKHFQVGPADSTALHGLAKDEAVEADFFAALERVDRLHDDCKTLVHCGFETAALDIMEKISLHREAAVERLFRWTQRACRRFRPDSLVPRSMQKLQSRPVLFKCVVDEYCAARKADVARSFIAALTERSESGKPIEHGAHDPERYVDDMLSWIRRTLPSERDDLKSLFGLCDSVDVDDEINSALAEITEGLRHPLRVRIELTLTSDKNPVLLCAMVDLLRFYGEALNEEVRDGPLSEALDELRARSEVAFLAAVEKKAEVDLSRGVRAPPSDLTPSPAVSDLLSFLRDLFAAAPMSDRRERGDLSKAVSLVVDPLLRAIDETACRLSSTDMAVYLSNCIYQIQCTVSLCRLVDGYAERLQAQSDAQMDTLTSEQASSLVANLDLGPIYTILQGREKGPLSAVPAMEASALRSFMNKFDGFMAMPDVFLLPQINLLMSSASRLAVRKRSFQVILAIYKNLYSSVHDPANRYENPGSIVRRTPEEVSELLAL